MPEALFGLITLGLSAVACVAIALPLLRGGRASVVASLLVAACLAVAGLYVLEGTPQALSFPVANDEATAPSGAKTDSNAPPSRADVEQALGSLREQLSANPEDWRGWALLAETERRLGRPEAAVEAYQQALKHHGSLHPDLVAGLVQTRAMTAEQGFIPDSDRSMLVEANRAAPEHQRVLWLLGVAALQRGEQQRAITAWEQLLPLLPPDSGVRTEVSRQLGVLRGDEPSAVDAGPLAASKQTPAPSLLKVELSLADTDAAQPAGPLFIFVRAQNSRMPVLAKRVSVSEWPVQVSISAEDSPMGGLPESFDVSRGDLELVARWSNDPSPAPGPGDWSSERSGPLLEQESLTLKPDAR